MTRRTVAALLVSAFAFFACDRHGKHQPGQPGAAGTSGRGEMTVGEALSGARPIFVAADDV